MFDVREIWGELDDDWQEALAYVVNVIMNGKLEDAYDILTEVAVYLDDFGLADGDGCVRIPSEDEISDLDPETAHYRLDAALLAVAEEAGYDDLVELYRSTPKWFA